MKQRKYGWQLPNGQKGPMFQFTPPAWVATYLCISDLTFPFQFTPPIRVATALKPNIPVTNVIRLTKINGWKHLSHVYYQSLFYSCFTELGYYHAEEQFSQILHRLYIRCSPTVHLQYHATFCCNNIRNPSLRIFTAAFTSRSCSSPHCGHFQRLIRKSFTASFRYPQSEHI